MRIRNPKMNFKNVFLRRAPDNRITGALGVHCYSLEANIDTYFRDEAN